MMNAQQRGLNRRETKERAASEKKKANHLSQKEEKLDLLLVRKEEEVQVRKPNSALRVLEASATS